ncbi:MAG: hypothetical protein K0V04_30105 [Deltaproteobacteria bacterium]|nr:hypothetical protein [Deltaproteobacteria bacterium]
MPKAMLGAALLSMLAGCQGLPEVKYETDRLQIAPEFDDPICEGTLLALDEHLGQVEDGLGEVGRSEPFRLYWMRDGIVDTCGEGRGGCFFPATRVMFAQSRSITHEMTHAVLDSVGDSYFLEEGMAELLSGVGVYHEPRADDVTPGERLRLSRSEYRNGHFDYDAAAHFMRWIYGHRGVNGVRRIAYEVEDGAEPSQLESTLEDVMGIPIDEIDVRYRNEAYNFYEGLSYERTPSLTGEEIDDDEELEGPEALQFSVSVDLSCASEDTLGPLPDDREGMYQVRRLRVPEHAGAVLTVNGEAGTWVEVYDPYARWWRGVMPDWMLPNPAIDVDGLHLEPGDIVDAELIPGVWAVVLGSDNSDQGTVSLHVELTLVSPKPDPSAPSGPSKSI